jgi:hypothetical protein
MKYLLLFCHREDEGPSFEELPPEAQADIRSRVGRWHQDNHAWLLDHGHRLASSTAATTLRRKEGGAVVTDGPFVEGNEVVAGYVVVDVPDLDEALRIARTFPACPTVEIRPIADM